MKTINDLTAAEKEQLENLINTRNNFYNNNNTAAAEKVQKEMDKFMQQPKTKK